MLPISIVPVVIGLLAVAAPAAASAQTLPPRVNSLELENTMISNYSSHTPGTQVGSEG